MGICFRFGGGQDRELGEVFKSKSSGWGKSFKERSFVVGILVFTSEKKRSYIKI